MEQLWEGRPWGGVGVSSPQAPLGSAYLTPDRLVQLAKARRGGGVGKRDKGGLHGYLCAERVWPLAPLVTPSLEAPA